MSRANAARERVAKMKMMLRSSGKISKRSSTETSTLEIITSYQDQETCKKSESFALVSDMHSESPSMPTTDVVVNKVNAIIDLYLETDVVPAPDTDVLDSTLIDEYFDSDETSRTTSDLEGSTAVEADLATESASSIYSIAKVPKYAMNACLAAKSVSNIPTAKIGAYAKARTAVIAEMQPPSAHRKELWHSYYPNARYSHKLESGFEPTQTLSPVTDDILYLSLTPIADTSSVRTSVDKPAMCAMCSQTLIPPRGLCRKSSAWMIHSGARSEAHFLHMECLRAAKSVWGPERGLGACVKCYAFRGVVRGLDEEEFAARVMRMEMSSAFCI